MANTVLVLANLVRKRPDSGNRLWVAEAPDTAHWSSSTKVTSGRSSFQHLQGAAASVHEWATAARLSPSNVNSLLEARVQAIIARGSSTSSSHALSPKSFPRKRPAGGFTPTKAPTLPPLPKQPLASLDPSVRRPFFPPRGDTSTPRWLPDLSPASSCPNQHGPMPTPGSHRPVSSPAPSTGHTLSLLGPSDGQLSASTTTRNPFPGNALEHQQHRILTGDRQRSGQQNCLQLRQPDFPRHRSRETSLGMATYTESSLDRQQSYPAQGPSSSPCVSVQNGATIFVLNEGFRDHRGGCMVAAPTKPVHLPSSPHRTPLRTPLQTGVTLPMARAVGKPVRNGAAASQDERYVTPNSQQKTLHELWPSHTQQQQQQQIQQQQEQEGGTAFWKALVASALEERSSSTTVVEDVEDAGQTVPPRPGQQAAYPPSLNPLGYAQTANNGDEATSRAESWAPMHEPLPPVSMAVPVDETSSCGSGDTSWQDHAVPCITPSHSRDVHSISTDPPVQVSHPSRNLTQPRLSHQSSDHPPQAFRHNQHQKYNLHVSQHTEQQQPLHYVHQDAVPVGPRQPTTTHPSLAVSAVPSGIVHGVQNQGARNMGNGAVGMAD
eukprot:TRINITY_DN3937_c0_g2_i1.p1 TRINITY_DN3937_c0_g2~~TRINITY_DN3937_c0_g2_i1.p1  ORF type:complete len:668 (-),score=85.46 TRINITY_DN3937_c0_g2_i1:622-2439(-)